jgi:hypothetical protein
MTQQVATTQTNMFGILDASIAKVFNTKETTRKDKDGGIIITGARLVMKSVRELETEFNLKGKDNREALTEKVLEQRDEGFRRVKAHINGLNGDSTLAKFETKKLANGVEQTTIVTQAISRKLTLSDEKVSKAWNIPLADVAAFRQMMEESAKVQAAKQVELPPEDVHAEPDNTAAELPV